MILLAGLALGSSVVMTRLGIGEIPPLAFITLRLGLAALIFLVALVVLQREIPHHPRIWLDIALVGIGNTGLGLVAFTLALQFISSGVLTIFLALIPLFTGLLAHFWLAQEKLNWVKLAGLVLAFFGVMLLLATRTTGLPDTESAVDLRGQLLALGGVVVSAVAIVYTRRRLQNTDVFVLTAGQMIAGLLFVLPLAFSFNTLQLSGISWRGWLAVAYNGIVGSFIGFLLLFEMIKRFGATVAALPGYVVPFVSILLGTMLLREIFTLHLGAGALLILLGVFWASR